MATATKAPKASGKNVGHVTQVIGSTFDVEFSEDSIPAIYNAVRIESHKKGIVLNLVGEVQQHLGGGKVRCVALGSTDGLIRGEDVVDTGAPLSVP
ncbi:MAG: F0F1 ATP synthase subunit beta, partial [Planctomycetia bacterium]|nr:F0F1 ATP synthase subunit beta [Planctomycetia bacterium]